MNYDFNLSKEARAVLAGCVGKKLVSYRLNETDDTSFEIFVLRLEEGDIEIAVNEANPVCDAFPDMVTTEVASRPNRDSWSRLGKSEPPNGIPPGGFMDYPVSKTITGVSAIVETYHCEEDSCEFFRGVVFEFGDDSLIFDKGAYDWETIWTVSHESCDVSELPQAEFDPAEEPNRRSSTRLERIA